MEIFTGDIDVDEPFMTSAAAVQLNGSMIYVWL